MIVSAASSARTRRSARFKLSQPEDDHHSIPHPQANVLSTDSFSRGVRSATDFSVYALAGVWGVSILLSTGEEVDIILRVILSLE